MTDYPIVKRLNYAVLYTGSGETSDLPEEAADLINEMAAALKPFAEACAVMDRTSAGSADIYGVYADDLRRARDVLKKARGE